MAADPISSQDPFVLAQVYQQRDVGQQVAGAQLKLAKDQLEQQGEIATDLIQSATRDDGGRRLIGVA